MSTEHQRPPEGWEEELHEALKRLPDRPAPETLLPRVMRAIQRRATVPWHQRSWWQWPVGLRAVSATAGIALLGALIWLIGTLPGFTAGSSSEGPAGVISSLSGTLSNALETALGAVLPYGASYAHLALPCFALLLVAMYATCIGLGTAVYQFARSQRS